MSSSEHTRVVILAGGDGQRLWSLTTDVEGRPVPKQFCTLGGRETLLERTLRRARTLAPPERTYVCVVEKHRSYWEPLLEHLPPENVVVQPENRGTAHGVLLPLVRLQRQDPHSVVVLMPSDHYFDDECVFLDAVARALATAASDDDEKAILVGVGAEAPNADYGWIIPGRALDDGTHEVVGFVEKPPLEQAFQLWQQEALWSTLVVAARSTSLFELFHRAASAELRLFVRLLLQHPKGSSLDDVYRTVAPHDFSRHVLTPSPDALRVMPAPACGWCDLGTPERVLRLRAQLEALAGAAAMLSSRPAAKVPSATA